MRSELLTKNQLIKKLNISIGKIDSMIKNNEIPYIKLGKLIRFNEEEVYEKLKELSYE